MRAVAHNLGFPRIGVHREMKKIVESYWREEITQAELKKHELALQEQNWQLQFEAGLDLIPVGDFSWYDHVLEASTLFGVIPERFIIPNEKFNIDTYFCMARGQAPNGEEATACEMTKWFDSNYHYIVPEFVKNQSFSLQNEAFFQAIDMALAKGFPVKPVLLGPLTFLWLGKCRGETFDKLSLLDKLIPVYEEVFRQLSERGIEWIQLDEPILVLDLPSAWQKAFTACYQRLNFSDLKCLLATYFGELGDNQHLVCQLPVDGIHIDLCRSPEQLDTILEQISADKVLSLGIVDGRNIWKTDLNKALVMLEKAREKKGDKLWLAGSCSLLHVPIDLDEETTLDPEIKNWLAFAKQKINEIVVLTKALNEGREAVSQILVDNQTAVKTREISSRIHNPTVKKRIVEFNESHTKRQHHYPQRAELQKLALKLPFLPTTTIGSFPQTKEIRNVRRDYKKGKIDGTMYEEKIRQEIANVIKIQENLDLDVLVHGEAERNDMVEYFGELLEGVAFTQNGWVQSYGSRCVKPPIIYGDIERVRPMTVEWSRYAQSLTPRVMKGMLTGPVTILAWSFVRDDQPHSETALQLAYALRDEVCDLESAGIKIIQIDEPAFRESLPLRRSNWEDYFAWAVTCFRVASCGVKDETQIHTHMCYSEFNDIIAAIAALDADVITLESSRSDMELLRAFEDFSYPNDIGPGVYDIHSPRVPTVEEIEKLLKEALKYIPKERLWVNPDCGLKTRGWEEVKLALTNMVQAAKSLRTKITVESEAVTTT